MKSWKSRKFIFLMAAFLFFLAIFSILEAGAAVNLTQAHYRWRNDDGREQVPVFRVQSYQGNMGTQSSVAIPITAVTGLNQAFILAPAGNMSVGRGSQNASQNAAQVLVRARFTAVNEVTLTRGSSTNNSYYSFFVIEDTSGNEIYVKSGSQAFIATDATLNIDVGSGISDYTKAVVFLTVSSSNASVTYYNQAQVHGRMTSNTNLELSRTAGNAAITVDWFVVEFKGSGWSVQQGDFTLNTGTQASPQTQTISSVTMADTFVYMNWSASTNGLDQTSAKVELYNSTTLRFSRQDTTTGTCAVRYFVVSHSNLNVQRGSASTLTTDSTKTQTITQIDTVNAFPITFNDCNGTATSFPRPYWRGWFSSNTTLYWDRAYTGQDCNFFWQVIDLSGFGSGGATFAANEDTKLTGARAGTSYRVRFEVANKGDQSSGAVTYQLQVARTSTCGSGVYSAVPTDSSGDWQIAGSTYITDGEATANISPGLTDEATTFAAGQLKDAGNTTGSITLNANEFTEIEFAVKATDNALDGGNYCFRLYNTAGGKTLDTYTMYAEAQLASCSFGYRKAITVQSGQVFGGPHTDFPMLVSISDADLKTTANGGKVASYDAVNNDPRDIIFRALDTATCNGTAPCTLDHEIEKYNASTGELVAWVRVPSINNGTVIYMYYGNSCINSSTQNASGVWDSNFKAVWHLGQTTGGAGAMKDSTSNNNHGTDNGSPTLGATGKIGNCVGFDGSNDHIAVPSSLSLKLGSGLTIEAWININVWGDWNDIVFKGGGNAGDSDCQFALVGTGFAWDGTYAGSWRTKYFNTTQDTGTWIYAVITHDTVTVSGYRDGSLISAQSDNGAIYESDYQLAISQEGAASAGYINGKIDEVRISNIVRSPGWIQTEYNNLSSPSTFYSYGSEQDLNYLYRKPITIDHTKLGASCSSDLSNFPVLISISNDNDLKNHVTSTYGYDIVFRSSDDKTKLDHEIESYTASSGTLVAWVRVPTFSSSTDTGIYMYYGNSSITSSTENPTGVWDSNYKGVWHLKEMSGTQHDSTQSGNDGTASVTTQGSASGKINGADGFSGTLDRVQVGTSNWTAGQGTLELWGYPTATTYSRYFFGHTTQPAFNNRIQLYTDDTTGNLDLGLGDSHTIYTNIQVLTPATWYHIVLTWNGSNYIVYVDGVSKANGSYTGLSTLQTFADIGNDGDTASRNEGFNGIIDEVRISNVARSACWIQTEYNNQNWPNKAQYPADGFITVGTEGQALPTAVDLVFFRATGQHASVLVKWETAQEISNLGFNLYRMAGTNGSFTKINKELIPGLVSSVRGRKYSYVDMNVIRGVLYYYMLEDVDLSGIVTIHGPVCVDWDGDGIPDDHGGQAIDDNKDNNKEDKGGSGPEKDLGPTEWAPSPGGESASWVKVGNFRARQEADGVSLEWVTSFEADNLGFHIYREQDGKYYRVTADLVPGSVFNAGAGRKLAVGQRYVYFDALSELTEQEFYWLDCVGLDGARASFGPIKPEIDAKPIPERLKARFQSIAKHQVSREEKLKKIHELRKELKSKETEMQASQAVFSSQTIISQVVPGKLSEPRLPPSEAQWVLAAKPGLKILVKEEGWYRVGQAELVAAGLDPWVDPRYLQLYVDGEEQSMTVKGSEDGRFDPEDALEFYGRGLDTPFSDTRVYWLVVGNRPGRRLDTPLTDIRMGLDIKMLLGRGLRGRGAPLGFPYTVELKERTFYFAALKNGEEESFFGSLIYTEPVDQLINAPHPAPSAPDNAKLEVVLQGATESSHQVKILFNNQEVSLLVFGGQNRGTIEIEIPQGLILEGENIVTLEAQGGLMDASLVDYIRLTYWRTYTADEDSLKFTAMGTERLSIGGFSSAEIRVVDITDPVQMFNVWEKVYPEGSGYATTVKVPGHGQRKLFAFSEEKVKEPAGVVANMVSSWHERTQGADVVIVSYRDFLESVRALKELREQQGFAVVLVDVEDLYDEFNFGSKSPWALREFLSRAYDRWVPAPRFVVLVGDASYDPRNYLGFGDFDLVPTKYVDTEYIKTASDDWFVDFDDDELPNMAVGRLPVDSVEEAEAVVSKIISYKSAAGFMNEVLLVTDANDGIYDFEGASAQVAALLPQDMTVRQILRGQNPAARNDLLGLLNQGQLIVNYIGHGSTEIWKGNLLTSSDAWDLTNSPYLPFLVSMTCLNGFFYDPSSESMAETFLKAQKGGAVAVWASSGLTYPLDQLPLNLKLIQLLFSAQGLTIGEAVVLSKQAFINIDVRKTWILFGDPTTKLR